jgi:hypothetical protein
MTRNKNSLVSKFEVTHLDGTTKIVHTDSKKRTSLPTAAWEVFQSLGSTPMKNIALKKLLVEKGACKDERIAAGLIEKFCDGFSNYNGWCQLLEGRQIEDVRHFTSVQLGHIGNPTRMMVQRKPKEEVSVAS